jgi:hypothetical protein
MDRYCKSAFDNVFIDKSIAVALDEPLTSVSVVKWSSELCGVKGHWGLLIGNVLLHAAHHLDDPSLGWVLLVDPMGRAKHAALTAYPLPTVRNLRDVLSTAAAVFRGGFRNCQEFVKAVVGELELPPPCTGLDVRDASVAASVVVIVFASVCAAVARFFGRDAKAKK